MIITSAGNPRLKQLRESLRNGHSDPDGLVPIEGTKLVQEAIKSQLQIEELFVSQSRRHDSDIEALLRQIPDHGRKLVEVSDRIFPSISGTETPQGLLGLARLPRVELNGLLAGEPLLLVAVQLQDPGNLGTLLRSAEAFGVSAALLTRNSVNPSNPKVIRSSAGSIFRVPCVGGFETQLLLDTLSEHGFELIATTPKATTDFRDATYRGKVALLVGNESRGLDETILPRVNTHIRVPMHSAVESLNAAVAISIVLCEAARQRG